MQENAMAKKLSRWYNTSKKKKKEINRERRTEIRESMQDVFVGFSRFLFFWVSKRLVAFSRKACGEQDSDLEQDYPRKEIPRSGCQGCGIARLGCLPSQVSFPQRQRSAHG